MSTISARLRQPRSFALPEVLAGKLTLVFVFRGIVAQLARIGVHRSQISLIGLSHVHWDHVGQAANFPTATLLVGKEDWDALSNVTSHSLAPWAEGHAPKTLVAGDHDIFGDGSVVMLATPGHTPGHHSLSVLPPQRGPVLLTGDLYHSVEQFNTKLVPQHDYNAEQTESSCERFDALAHTLNATIIIQHEPQDVAKLPRFPQFAQ